MDYSKRLTEVLNAVGVKVGPHSEDSVVDLTQLEGPHEATGQAEEAINYQSTGEEEEHPIVHPINLENIHEVKVLDSPHKNEF